MAFAVATPVFEGPFDLLLHLILREQVDIYEVSLSRIVDAYLAEIEKGVRKLPTDMPIRGQLLDFVDRRQKKQH